MKLSPKNIFAVYLLIIVVYGLLYLWIPSATNLENPSFLKCTYFSAVTITTLGYGEITPASNLGMILSGSEAIIGIILIGIFLNTLWKSFSDRVERSQRKAVAEEMEQQNRHRMRSLYHYLSAVFDDYITAINEITTPMNKRDYSPKLNKHFKFSDLKHMFRQSLLFKNGFSKPAIEIYFDKQDVLFEELKYFIANTNSLNYPDLHRSIIEFLKIARQQDVRDGLFSLVKMSGGKEPMKDQVEKLIEENEDCPEGEQYRSHVLTPVIMFYKILTAQVELTDFMQMQFNKVCKQNC